MTQRYVVMTSAGHATNGYGFAGRYRNVAVCLVDADNPPKMISTRARGMIRMVQQRRGCYVGTMERSAYARACQEAEILTAKLSAELDAEALASRALGHSQESQT
jgi:hypothetical protein